MPGLFFSVIRRQLVSTLFPYTTLFRSRAGTMTFCVPVPSSGSYGIAVRHDLDGDGETDLSSDGGGMSNNPSINIFNLDRKSTRLNSSHVEISYAVFCLKKKKFQGILRF